MYFHFISLKHYSEDGVQFTKLPRDTWEKRVKDPATALLKNPPHMPSILPTYNLFI